MNAIYYYGKYYMIGSQPLSNFNNSRNLKSFHISNERMVLDTISRSWIYTWAKRCEIFSSQNNKISQSSIFTFLLCINFEKHHSISYNPPINQLAIISVWNAVWIRGLRCIRVYFRCHIILVDRGVFEYFICS